MDVTSYLDGQRFIWNSDKARADVVQHGVTFELAREAFFDPFVVYDDATAADELRQGIIGAPVLSAPTTVVRCLSREGKTNHPHHLRRRAEPEEEFRYDNQNE